MKIYKVQQTIKHISLFSVLIFLQIECCLAQKQLSGSVFSAKDSTAISGVTVYFEGTSFGVNTDDEGYFNILFKQNNAHLVISSIGYEDVIIDSKIIQKNKTLPNIYLSEKLEELETIYLEADKLSRVEKLKIFKREFLGSHPSAKLCKIINEKSIRFTYQASTNTLTATCNEPLLIANEYLGYLLKYNLRDFVVMFKEGDDINKKPISVHYHGYSYFKRLRNKTSRKNIKNRKKSYDGSTLHFMRSLYAKKLDQNNFKIFYKDTQLSTYTCFKITEEDKIKQVKILIDKIIVVYKNKYSTLIPKGEFTIDASGHHNPPESINLYGEMSKKRISELLPLDYNPL